MIYLLNLCCWSSFWGNELLVEEDQCNCKPQVAEAAAAAAARRTIFIQKVIKCQFVLLFYDHLLAIGKQHGVEDDNRLRKMGERLLLSFYAGHLREDLRFVERHLIMLGWEFKLSNRREEFNIYNIFNI